EDDADAAAAFLRFAHLRKHMLKKKQRTIINPRRAGTEAALETQGVMFLFDETLLLFPLHPEWRISQHVIKLVVLEPIFRKGVAEDDVIGVLAFDEHVGFADGPRIVVPILTIEHRLGLAFEFANIIYRNGEHP